MDIALKFLLALSVRITLVIFQVRSLFASVMFDIYTLKLFLNKKKWKKKYSIVLCFVGFVLVITQTHEHALCYITYTQTYKHTHTHTHTIYTSSRPPPKKNRIATRVPFQKFLSLSLRKKENM